MSIFGVITTIVVVVALVGLKKYYKNKKENALIRGCIVWMTPIFILQIVFMFNDAFCLWNLFQHYTQILLIFGVAIGLFLFIRFILLHGTVSTVVGTKMLLLLAVFVSLIYTEYFNGSYTFSDYRAFSQYNLPLKKYYFVLPYKLLADDGASVYKFPCSFSIPIKKVGDRLYYYEHTGFGRPGRWYEFGIPRRQQGA